MPRRGAADRVQRVLELVPWIVARDGPTRAEICEHFGISDDQLSADLGVVWFVGLPPYTPDSLIEVVQEDDRVWIRYPEVFQRPQRLTPDQGLALLAAGASVLALPGADQAGPLARGVAKLAKALDVTGQAALEIDLGAGRIEIVEPLHRAIAEGRRVRLDYYAFGRDERSTRDVDPHRLQAEGGSLYLLGHCHSAGGDRWFRVDRIHAVNVLDAAVGEHSDEGPASLFDPDADVPRVTLDLSPSAGWVVDAYPLESVEDLGDGRTRVTLAISARPWLERLLLQLGPDVRLVDAPGELREAGPVAAARVLARYTLPPQ